MRHAVRAGTFAAILLAGAVAGCSARTGGRIAVAEDAPVDSAPDAPIIIYIDGAGGGGPVTDGTPDVRRGFRESGFDGEFRAFRWQTGLGALADQVSSLSYKRGAAKRLAEEIEGLRDAAPTAEIHLVATSAGSAVALFALEALGDDRQVDSVVLLSSAVSADYDLTAALAHIKVKLVVFRNDRDSLLRSVIPLVGSADRRHVGDRVAGLYGFLPPESAEPVRLEAYAKMITIDWCDDFRRFDHAGGHTDCKSPSFICRVIAPLVLEQSAPSLARR